MNSNCFTSIFKILPADVIHHQIKKPYQINKPHGTGGLSLPGAQISSDFTILTGNALQERPDFQQHVWQSSTMFYKSHNTLCVCVCIFILHMYKYICIYIL